MKIAAEARQPHHGAPRPRGRRCAVRGAGEWQRRRGKLIGAIPAERVICLGSSLSEGKNLMDDHNVLEHIEKLVGEEHELLSGDLSAEAKAARLKQVSEQLDQCWDLLRQRRARREFGQDPDAAEVRDVGTVERYLG